MDLALRLGVFVLLQKRCKTRVRLDCVGLLCIQVGRTPGESFETFHLAFFVGEVLSQDLQADLTVRIGLRLNTHQFAAVEGTEVVFLAVHFEGRQVGDAHVVAEQAADDFIVPRTGDNDRTVVCEDVAGGGGQMALGVDQFLHALDSDETFGAVERIGNGNEFAVVAGGPIGLAAGCKEPGCKVPCGGVGLEREGLARRFAIRDQLFKRINVFLGDNALVIVHEVAVIGGQRVRIERIAGSCRRNNAGIVCFLDDFCSFFIELDQRIALYKTSKLVLREAVDVCACGNVNQHLICARRFGNTVDGRDELDAFRVGVVEVFDLLLGQINSRFADPNGNLVGDFVAGRNRFVALRCGFIALRRGFVALRCRFVALRCRFIALRCGSCRRRVARDKCENHHESKQNCQCSFHNFPPV